MSSTVTKGKLLVRGSINIDEFFVLPHIVRSGETISSTDYSKRAGGKGANQAVSAAKAGAEVSFAGHIGNDGAWLRELLEGYKVDTSQLHEDPSVPTGRAMIQLSTETRDNSIVLLPGANFSTSPLPFSSLASAGYTHLLLQNEIPLASTRSFLTEAHQAGLVTIFNPSPMLSPAELESFEWNALDWLLVNEGEAEELVEILGGKKVDSAEVLSALRRVESLKGLTGILMTRGGDGVVAALGGPEGDTIHVGPGEVVGSVVDTTGAGDCFTGYFTTLLSSLPPSTPLSSSKLAAILNVASQAAAMCVEKEGAMESVPMLRDVKERMESSGRWKSEESWSGLL
ncbi:Ribokinase-like protein [Leucosporidium creatinivorum]|uniref:Ribokinase n=1 Tax=Leucosporidium creatinivorum TaxID=106004 RepID=A0A1Y2DMK1_9BASI|nr:Ribokinase-like protein [Leucosporidium creatinivorum]